MKTLTLHIGDSIYNDVKNFLSLFSSDKIKIEESISDNLTESKNLTYDEFEKKWAGLLKNENINKKWKEEHIDYLYNKHL